MKPSTISAALAWEHLHVVIVAKSCGMLWFKKKSSSSLRLSADQMIIHIILILIIFIFIIIMYMVAILYTFRFNP